MYKNNQRIGSWKKAQKKEAKERKKNVYNIKILPTSIMVETNIFHAIVHANEYKYNVEILMNEIMSLTCQFHYTAFYHIARCLVTSNTAVANKPLVSL